MGSLMLAAGCNGTKSTATDTEKSPPTRAESGSADTAPGPGQKSPTRAARPAGDVARDADRKPHQVLEFFGIKTGQKVVELQSGKGYYAELLSAAVGPSGQVYAHNSPFVLEKFAEKPLSERLARPGLENVRRLDTELDAPELPKNLDAVLIILFYHDAFWQQVDRVKMNKAVFEALEPGGIYGVVDHYAEDGSGDRDVKTLHRVDIDTVKKEITAAGFVLDGESDLLRHPEDQRTINVFKPEIRGKTDRFILRFRKPAQ